MNDKTRRERIDALYQRIGWLEAGDAGDPIRALSGIVLDLITVVTDADRDRAYDIEMERRNHDALDKRVALLAERMGDLTERLTTLEHRVVLEGLNPPAPESTDDDPLDLDACEPGTLLRDRRGDWWLRTSGGWRMIYDESAADGAAPEREIYGPFEVVHRG